MMSPFVRRGDHNGSWTPVVATSGEVRGIIQFEGSVRATHADETFKHIKGTFTLERWSGSPTLYRVSCVGFHAITEADTVGEIAMPQTAWNPVASKGKSNNMLARMLMMKMKSWESEDGMKQLQVIIPVVSGGHRAAKTVFEAFVAADTELKTSGENLLGRH